MIGTMSGSSLDGLDIAYCVLTEENERWNFKIPHATTIEYPEIWVRRLAALSDQSGLILSRTDSYYGKYTGELVKNFMITHGLVGKIDAVASHGHAIFHDPAQGISVQVGSGAQMAALLNVPVITDFRSADIAAGGEGAPLAPIADTLLYPEYAYCLNLGGFANISVKKMRDNIMGCDLTVCNLLLNRLANRNDQAYDDKGTMAKRGRVVESLLEDLGSDSFFSTPPPKSAWREWFEKDIWPRFLRKEERLEDLMATAVLHIATEVNRFCTDYGKDAVNNRILVTGGGAWNSYLVETIETLTGLDVLVPPAKEVNYKEALLMALMGALRLENKINTLPTVSGAKKAVSAGVVYSG